MNGKWTDYPLLRDNLAPGFAELSDEQIDALVQQFYGEGFTGEDLEGFFDSIKHGLSGVAGAVGNFAQKAAPAVMNTLPGIAQGAMAGSALGPFGMLAGAIAGGAGSALSQSKNPTLSGIGRGLGTVTQLASAGRGGGAAGGIGGLLQGGLSQLGKRGGAAGGIGGRLQGRLSQRGGRGGAAGVGDLLQGGLSQLGGPGGDAGGALGGITNLFGGALQGAPGQALPAGASANTLLGMLARPEVGQALMSAAMGGLGRQSVPIGSSQVDVQSILNALSSLAGQAADEMAGTGSEALPEYFYGEDGELAFDPAERHSRTNALLTYMVLTAPSWAQRPPGPVVVVQPPPQREPVYTEADAEADEWLWAEVYESDYQEDEAYA
ncbi:MAG: hypothetical protein QOH32_450 [Bradyrhizobium sp.]|jgi:hypothetical protein|nr:hypothetical protein [Bradyrhizobium sp.]